MLINAPNSGQQYVQQWKEYEDIPMDISLIYLYSERMNIWLIKNINSGL